MRVDREHIRLPPRLIERPILIDSLQHLLALDLVSLALLQPALAVHKTIVSIFAYRSGTAQKYDLQHRLVELMSRS